MFFELQRARRRSCEIDATDIITYVEEPKLDKRERMLFDVNAITWPK